MNFTREPVVETIITARNGFNLLVRNSKNNNCDEYIVDSIEVVVIGGVVFYRSAVRPSEFLVPISDYEVIEQKLFHGHQSGNKGFHSGSHNHKEDLQYCNSDSHRKDIHYGRNRQKQVDSSESKKRGPKISSSDFVSEQEKISDRASRVLSTLIPAPTTLVSEHLTSNKKINPNSKRGYDRGEFNESSKRKSKQSKSPRNGFE